MSYTDKYKDVDVPTNLFISHGKDTDRLYELEDKRNDLIQKCAKEWAKIMDIPPKEYWNTAVPQALHDTLSSFAPKYSIAAVIGYLETEIPRLPANERQELKKILTRLAEDS